MSTTKPHEFADHFSNISKNYSAFRPGYPDELFQWLARVAPANDLAWDCATGNGQAALGLVAHFKKVIATDASKAQIINARRHERVEFRTAPAHASGLPSQSLDLITTAQALHWFDRPSFYAESRRVLRPNGVIAVWAYGLMRFKHPKIDVLLDDFYANIVGPFWPPERVLIEQRYQTIEFPFPEIKAPEFQMEGRYSLETLTGYLKTWSATQRFIVQNRFDPVDPLIERISVYWPRNQTMIPLDWPIFLRVGKTG